MTAWIASLAVTLSTCQGAATPPTPPMPPPGTGGGTGTGPAPAPGG
jgi:hypothetical protein